ncbi:MAG TPA: hypothetical protein VJX16_18970 [Terriglobales bacterium]|nr:hypothetical protein [Terriglobales bacterium]
MLSISVQQLFAVVFIIVLFGFGLAVDSVSNKRRDAELLVHRMAELRLSTSSFNDARALAEEYGGKPEKEEDCSAHACAFIFVIDNRPLNYIPGVRAVRLVATLRIKDGYVIEQQINYTILDFAYLLIDHLAPHAFEVQKLRVDANGMPHLLKVDLGQSATADERRRAYSIELSCLSRLGGCRHASAAFPVGL